MEKWPIRKGGLFYVRVPPCAVREEIEVGRGKLLIISITSPISAQHTARNSIFRQTPLRDVF